MNDEEHKEGVSREGASKPKPKHLQTQTKHRKRREILLLAFGGVVFGIAQFWATPSHKFSCLFVSYALMGSGVYYELRHHSASIKNALFKVVSGIVIVTAVTVCALLDKPVTSIPNSGDNVRELSDEIDDSIRRVFLVLKFPKDTDFSLICPFRADVHLSKGFDDFKFSISDLVSRDSSNSRTMAYRVTPSVNGDVIHPTDFAFYDVKVQSINIPVPIWSLTNFPFRVIRDFEGAKLRFDVSENLTHLVTGAELIVNGWGIFNTNVIETNWIRNNTNYSLLSKKQTEVLPPTFVFVLTVHNRSAEFYKSLSGPVNFEDTGSAHIIGIDMEKARWKP